MRFPILAAACWVAAGFALSWPANRAAAELRAGSASREELVARLQSDSWSIRHAALRELRNLSADDGAWLGELAGHRDPQVRATALDVLSQWGRGNDEKRRIAGRNLLAAIASQQHDGSQQAAARLEAILSEVERSALHEMATFFNPVLELT
jgi:hypothetical protein